MLNNNSIIIDGLLFNFDAQQPSLTGSRLQNLLNNSDFTKGGAWTFNSVTSGADQIGYSSSTPIYRYTPDYTLAAGITATTTTSNAGVITRRVGKSYIDAKPNTQFYGIVYFKETATCNGIQLQIPGSVDGISSGAHIKAGDYNGETPIQYGGSYGAFTLSGYGVERLPNDWVKTWLTGSFNGFKSTGDTNFWILPNQYYNGTTFNRIASAGVCLWKAQFYYGDKLEDYIDGDNKHFAWYDQSPNGYVGTVSGAVLSLANNGKFVFNGEGDFIKIDDADSLTFTDAQFTMEAWVRPVSASFNSQLSIMTKANYSANQREYQFQVRQSSGTYYAYFGMNDNNTTWTSIGATSSTPINVKEWSHIVVTSNGYGYGRIYIDGIFKEDTSLFHSSLTNLGADLYIGVTYTANGFVQCFPGDIAVCRQYTRALTEREIKQNYNALKRRFGK